MIKKINILQIALFLAIAIFLLPSTVHAIGWSGNLPTVSADAKTKLLLVNGVYYLGFTSSTDTGYHLFLATSTNGNAGTWSQPVDVFGFGISQDTATMSTARNGLFALDYNSVAGYFGAAIYYDTGAGNQIRFSTSTNGIDWSNYTVAVSGLDMGSSGRNLYLDFTESGNLGVIFYDSKQYTFTTVKAAFTSDNGANWNISSSSYSVASGALVGGRVSGDSSSPVFHFGYANASNLFPANYNLQYVSSVDFGSNWSTSTVKDSINYNGVTPNHDLHFTRLATFDLDSLDRPTFMYYMPTADSGFGGPPDYAEYTTSSLMFSQSDGSGGWITATSIPDIAWQVATNDQESDNLAFYGTVPIFTGVGPSFLPAVLVNTSSWNVFPLSQSVTSSDFSRPSTVYSSSTQILASAYVLSDGSFNFSTTSMSLPAPDNVPSVVAINPVFSNSVSGLVTVTTTVSDVDNDSVSLKVQYSLNGGSTWSSSTVHIVSGGGSATTSSGKINNITGTSVGRNLVFTWDTRADGLSVNANALLRIIPNDGLVNGSAKTSASFAVNDWNGNLPTISTDGQTKLLQENGVYYLGYSSEAIDGTYHVYFTTSTSGNDGSWSQPVDVFNYGIRPDTFYSTSTPINGNFALNYNSVRGYFGAAIYATGSQQIWFASSTAGSVWSATTTVATIFSMEQNPQVRRRLFLDFSKTNNLATIFYNDSPSMGKSTVNMAYSDNDGVGMFGSWSNSTANIIQGELIGGRVTGSAASHTFYVGYFMSESGMDQYSLVYASSTSMMWYTSKVASGLNYVDGSANLSYPDLYGFNLDDNLNPAFTYYQTNALNTSTFETTSSLIYVSGNSSTTIASNIHWQLVDNSNQKLVNLFFNSSTPIFVGAGSNFAMYGAANTSTWDVFSINNSPLSQKSNVSAVYDSSTEYLASAYVLNNGALKFTKTSLNLTIIPPPPPVAVVPTGLNISPVSTTVATINWTSGHGDENVFFLEFSIDGGETHPYSATTSAASTSYSLRNLFANTQYFVRLSSAVSGVATSSVVTTSFFTANYDPIMPFIGIYTTSSVPLSWQENGNPSNTVYRIIGGDSVVEVASTSVELPVTPNTTYNLFVASLNHDGSANTAVSFGYPIMTPATIPGKPTVAANGQTSMIVSWSANSNSTSTIYKLYNITDSIIVTSSITSTSFTVTNLVANTPYQFNVSAYYGPANISETDASENSDAASTASVANTVSISLSVGASSTFQFLVDGVVHTATLNYISDGRASITVESNPVNVILGAGQSQNIDTNGNGVNDMSVTMNSVGLNSASFSLASYTPPVVSSGGGGFSVPVVPLISNAATAVTLASGESTDSQTITLNFFAINATQLAISEDQNFADSSWQTYVSSKQFVLSKGFGIKTIYVKFRSKDGGVTQVYKVIVNYIDNGGKKTKISNQTALSLGEEQAMFETSNPDSNIIISLPKKLQYTSNSKINYTYQYTNSTDKTLKTKIVRQMLDVKNKVVNSISGARVINSGKVFKFNVSSLLIKTLKDGVYTIKIKVLDAKTGKVLDENGFNITVKKPVPVKVVKKVVVPVKKK